MFYLHYMNLLVITQVRAKSLISNPGNVDILKGFSKVPLTLTEKYFH